MSYRRRDTYTQALNKARREQAQQAAQSDGASPAPHIPRKYEPYTRPILTEQEKAEATARAQAALRAEREDNLRDKSTSRKLAYCEWCGELATKRTLCETHYRTALRAGELDAYPTKQFLDKPDTHAIWLIDYYPDMLKDALLQAGWQVTPREP